MSEDKERIQEKIRRTDGGCQIWTGAINSGGYPVIKLNDKTELVTRVLYKLKHGSLPPDSKDMIHSCDNPKCVNPSHLKPGTTKQNMHEMFEKGRARPHGKSVEGLSKEASIEILLEKAALRLIDVLDNADYAAEKLIQDRASDKLYEREMRNRSKMQKLGFATSQYSGPLGPVRFKQDSGAPPFRMPSPHELPGVTSTKKEAFATTPMGRLLTTRKIGLPKTSTPAGPSIAQMAKPEGFGRPIAGATKNGV